MPCQFHALWIIVVITVHALLNTLTQMLHENNLGLGKLAASVYNLSLLRTVMCPRMRTLPQPKPARCFRAHVWIHI